MAKKTKARDVPQQDDYRKIPALREYIDRIGAEQLSFRRFMVKEHKGGYYIERSIILLMEDGSVKCTRKEYEPTKKEADAIREAILEKKWPVSIEATKANVEALKKKLDGEPYVFWNLARSGVIMVQERIEVRSGGKIFIQWTMFSDGEWRKMEPEGRLPFWKPENMTSKIMIHEGAKAAAWVDSLINDEERREELAAHPWGKELMSYCHWGLIGGALAPHRADYAELKAAQPGEVVYVCDNDWEGQSALQEVSRHWGGSLKGIRFDKRWRGSWDLADAMPKTMYSGKRWVGPSLKSLIVPATYATELVPPAGGGKGRPLVVMRRAFKEEWYHSVRPEAFVHKDWPNQILTSPEFNSQVRPFSDTDDTARLLKMDATSKSADLKYDPARIQGIYGAGEAGRFINTYCPPDIASEEGNAGPFIDFMNHLVEDEEDCKELIRWCATLVRRPAIKMSYGVLMISEVQGVGKGTLGEKILAPLVGASNVSYPSEGDVVESSFNYWQAHKRLAVVHEIYAGQSTKAYNKLKSIITDKSITVNKKFMAAYEIENWMHMFACSNSMRALQLSAEDRRWLVPKITEEKKTPKYWSDLNSWLVNDGGLQIISWWLEKWLEKNPPVTRSDPAPWSKQKRAVVEEGYSPGMSLVAAVLDRVKQEMDAEGWIDRNTKPVGANGEWRGSGVSMIDMDLVRIITYHIYEGRRSDRLEKPITLRKLAKSKRWYVHPERVPGTNHGMLICSKMEMTERPIKDVLKATRPLDVVAIAREWFPL